MNPEQLESLLLDRELGELSPAVAALLEAHLAHEPAAAHQATEISTTIQLTRRAVATPIVAPTRILDAGQLRREHRAAQNAARRTELSRLAACLTLGLGLGWFARPAPSPGGSTATVAQSAAPAAATPAEPRSTFWSIARLTASQRPTPPAGAASRRSLH